MMKVSNIRIQDIKITKEPIVYYWWFKTSCFNNLLSLLNGEINVENIVTKKINNEDYGLLYIGKGKNGHDRLIKYHIYDSQNFHNSGVVNGRLSSLRQTLCGLLQLQMSISKVAINDFMDQNCFVEFETCSLQELDNLEHQKIRNNYLPLNFQNTLGILTSNHRKILTQSKKRMRR
jgi:hypothetical protein